MKKTRMFFSLTVTMVMVFSLMFFSSTANCDLAPTLTCSYDPNCLPISSYDEFKVAMLKALQLKKTYVCFNVDEKYPAEEWNDHFFSEYKEYQLKKGIYGSENVTLKNVLIIIMIMKTRMTHIVLMFLKIIEWNIL